MNGLHAILNNLMIVIEVISTCMVDIYNGDAFPGFGRFMSLVDVMIVKRGWWLRGIERGSM